MVYYCIFHEWTDSSAVFCLCVCVRVVEIVEVPVDVHDATLSTSPLISSSVSPVSKVFILLLLY